MAAFSEAAASPGPALSDPEATLGIDDARTVWGRCPMFRQSVQ
jgi:hypothetical protein